MQRDDLIHVSTPKAINGLLRITYGQVEMLIPKAVINQRQEIGKLQLGGILKLINQDMIVFFAQTFIDKRHRVFGDNF